MRPFGLTFDDQPLPLFEAEFAPRRAAAPCRNGEGYSFGGITAER